MNRIIKSEQEPTTLLEKGAEATSDLQRKVIAGRSLESNDFNKNIYAATDVKRQLLDDQKRKCAYCERFLNGDFGAVEHFRPKGGYQQTKEDTLHKPGYYWLAYDWSNLLFSCSECNTRYKRNLFPLTDDAQRDIAHEDISRERPLLLNPATDNLEEIIEFNRWIISAKASVDIDRAEETIALLKLNDRNDLVKRRRDAWNAYQKMSVVLSIAEKQGNEELIALASKQMAEIKSESSEFTGMYKYQSNA